MSKSTNPLDYPETRRGYRNYLKAIGLNPDDQENVILFGMTYKQFFDLDRRPLSERIEHAKRVLGLHIAEAVIAEAEGRKQDALEEEQTVLKWRRILAYLHLRSINEQS